MSVRRVVAEVLRTYGRRLTVLLAIAALPLLPLDVAVGVFDPDYSDVAPSRTGYGVSLILLYVVATPLATAAIVAYLDDERRGRGSIGAAFRRVDRLGTLAAATLFYNVATIAATVLLVVPGLLLAARWATYVPAIMLEGASATGGLRRSNGLVRGHTWAVVGVGLLVALPGIALAVAPVAVGVYWESVYGAILYGAALDLALVPLYAVAAYVIYRRLVEEA